MTTQSTQLKEIETMPQATSAYREYVDVIRPADAPRAELNDFQLVSSTVRLWWLRTRYPLDVVLQDGFYTNVADLRLRAEDRVEVVASNGGEGPAEHATLVVDSVNKSGGEIRVSLLHRYERS